MKSFELVVLLLEWLSSQSANATQYSDVSCIFSWLIDPENLPTVYEAIQYAALAVRLYMNRYFF